MPGRNSPAKKKEYDNTNKFSLFPNDKMRHGHRDPDLSGYINIDGVEYWFKGWTYYNDDDTVKVISGLIGDEREKPADEKPAPKGNQGGRKSGRR